MVKIIVRESWAGEEQQINCPCADLRPETSPPLSHEMESEVSWSTDVLDVVR